MCVCEALSEFWYIKEIRIRLFLSCTHTIFRWGSIHTFEVSATLETWAHAIYLKLKSKYWYVYKIHLGVWIFFAACLAQAGFTMRTILNKVKLVGIQKFLSPWLVANNANDLGLLQYLSQAGKQKEENNRGINSFLMGEAKREQLRQEVELISPIPFLICVSLSYIYIVLN